MWVNPPLRGVLLFSVGNYPYRNIYKTPLYMGLSNSEKKFLEKILVIMGECIIFVKN